jgi:hypothetical protein
MRTEVAAWFDNAMDRVSGAYKRWTLLWNFLIALGLAIAMNISAIHVARALWRQPAVVNSISKISGNDAAAAVRNLEGLALPIGWHACVDGAACEKPSWAERVGGWFITALAALFGAPFWFDLLQKIIRLKAAGPSPAEKRDKKAAAE